MRRRGAARVAAGLALALLAGCATLHTAEGGTSSQLDPFEKWNRKVFAFNEDLDRAVLIPVATGYNKALPEPARGGIRNFFANIRDAWSAVNNMLQGKVENGLHDVIRVGTNSVFGLFGFLDVASEMGLDHQYEDFGQTLGRWGVGAGAYVVLPLLGPSSVRDTIAAPFDYYVASPSVLLDNGGAQLGIGSLNFISTRASLLGASRIIDEISLDKYTFVRDAYLQRRRNLIYDGNPPERAEPNAPDAPAPDAEQPAGQAPNRQAPDTQAPDMRAPDTQAPGTPPAAVVPAAAAIARATAATAASVASVASAASAASATSSSSAASSSSASAAASAAPPK